METITINATENQNNQQLHVVDNLAGGLNDDHSIDEDQIMQLTSITDLTQDDIVTIPKEIILISLVSQEQALYNPKHEYYRNTQRKDVKWMEIAEHVGWSETQCKAKWKAMRDQYCRELKRSKFNIKANVKWKYFKELDFLRPYALARNYRPRNPVLNSQQSVNNNNSGNSNNNNNNNNTNIMYSCTTAEPTTTTLTAPTSMLTDLTVTDNNSGGKFDVTRIKIESNNNIQTFDTCAFVNNNSNINNNKANQATTSTLVEHQLHNVLRQQSQQQQQHQTNDNNWSYLTGSTGTTTTTAASTHNNVSNVNNSNASRLHQQQHNLTVENTDHHLLNNNRAQQQTTDEALYNALVDCVGQIQQQQQQQQHQQQLCEQTGIITTSASPSSSQIPNQQTQPQYATGTAIAAAAAPPPPLTTTDEEDDDPIHTFLNIESYFEKELILLIQNEDVLYNSYHPSYRNVKVKMEIWDEIGRKLKKTVKQCRLKWKALRDQFIREHKRLKHRENVETIPRWKHYDALSFLQKFIKHKASDFDMTKASSSGLLPITKTEMDTGDMDEDDDDQMNMVGVNSPLHSPLENIKLELQQQSERSTIAATPTTGQSNLQQQQQQHQQTYTQIPTLANHHSHHQLHQQHNHHDQHSNHSDNLCVSSGSVEGCYDDMDIDDYIIGDGDGAEACSNTANGVGDDGRGDDDGGCNSSSVMEDSQSCKTEMDHHADGVDDRKSQHNDFNAHLYNNMQHAHTTNNNNNPNNLSELQQQHQQQHHVTNINLHDNKIELIPSTLINRDNNEMHETMAQSSNQTSGTTTTSTSFNYSKATMTTATTVGATEAAAATAAETINGASPISPLNGLKNHSLNQMSSISKSHENSATIIAAAKVTPTTTEAYTNTTPLASPINYNHHHHQQQQQQQQQQQLHYQYQYLHSNSSLGPTTNDVDDEVGAFFKAIAMKIRNAKMSPVAFTDLQIDILKVINCSLRNH